MDGRWVPMKRTALALNHLVSTRFRSDALQIVAFGRYARTVTAAEVGYPDLAYDLLAESVFTDLHDLHNNVSSGLHIAALAGAWTDCVAGFGGMRDFGGNITFAPRLPKRLTYMSFRMIIRDSKIVVAVDKDNATYRLLSGPPIDLAHHGEKFTLESAPMTMHIPELEYREPPKAPPGCEPYRREI